jgi:hypothetical protein
MSSGEVTERDKNNSKAPYNLSLCDLVNNFEHMLGTARLIKHIDMRNVSDLVLSQINEL